MNSVDEIKQRLDIVNMISEHVQLGKAGRNFRGLCPFHTEKTPSFFVFPERQSWHCYGCGAGGDVISFVMKKEGLGFGEALNILASRAGVYLPEKKTGTTEDKTVNKLYQINDAAARYFHELLLNSPPAEGARKYVESRQLSSETITEFRLGFSLDSWEGLKQKLQKQGYSEANLVSAGLAIAKEDRTYDRFRGRLMFPICDVKGRVLGFGARSLDDSAPKYLNSAESSIFTKSSVLYGIDLAKGAIREQGKAVIVEGYMDVLTAHQNGFRNVVASMGTALTEKQIAILKGLSAHICLSLDADAAGNAATLRGIEVCRNILAEEVKGTKKWLGGATQLYTEITIISMPEGKDPDEVIAENPNQWQQLINEAQPLMDFLIDVTTIKYDLSKPEGKSQLSNELLPLIAEMRDSAVREEYLTKLSKLTGISEKVLVAKIPDLLSSKRKPSKSIQKQMEVPFSTLKTGDQLEEHCLSLLLQYPRLRNAAENLSADHFERSENREIFVVLHNAQENDDIQKILDAALHEHLQTLVNKQHPPTDKGKQQQDLSQCIRRLEMRKHQVALAAEKDIEENSLRLTELWRQDATSGRR
ncbi:DNA primase [Chloroflexota bacterium]